MDQGRGPEVGLTSRDLLLVPKVHNDSAVVAFAGARRDDSGVLGQSEVHDTTLVGWHGLQRDRMAGIGDSSGDTVGQVAQRLVTAFLVTGDVEEEIDPLADLAARQEADHELEGSEGLASPPDQKAGVVAVHVEDGTTDVLSVGLLEVHNRVYLHLLDKALEDFSGDVYDL